MKIEFQNNEFTKNDILDYLTKAYGAQVNGKRFTAHSLNNWEMMKRIPKYYGGHKILKVEKQIVGRPIKIYTLEGLSRDDIKDVDLLPNKFPINNNKVDERTIHRKKRTQLYYDILAKAGKQYTRKTFKDSILPDNWKEIGIKQNQLPRRRKKTLTT